MRVIPVLMLCLLSFSLPAMAGEFSLSSPQVSNGAYVPKTAGV